MATTTNKLSIILSSDYLNQFQECIPTINDHAVRVKESESKKP